MRWEIGWSEWVIRSVHLLKTNNMDRKDGRICFGDWCGIGRHLFWKVWGEKVNKKNLMRGHWNSDSKPWRKVHKKKCSRDSGSNGANIVLKRALYTMLNCREDRNIKLKQYIFQIVRMIYLYWGKGINIINRENLWSSDIKYMIKKEVTKFPIIHIHCRYSKIVWDQLIILIIVAIFLII